MLGDCVIQSLEELEDTVVDVFGELNTANFVRLLVHRNCHSHHYRLFPWSWVRPLDSTTLSSLHYVRSIGCEDRKANKIARCTRWTRPPHSTETLNPTRNLRGNCFSTLPDTARGKTCRTVPPWADRKTWFAFACLTHVIYDRGMHLGSFLIEIKIKADQGIFLERSKDCLQTVGHFHTRWKPRFRSNIQRPPTHSMIFSFRSRIKKVHSPYKTKHASWRVVQ